MTYDEDSFIKEILANPYGDGTRLVYADWLDEQDDPRAQFLRLECEGSQELLQTDLEIELTSMLSHVDHRWIEAAGRRYDVVLMSFGNDKIMACKAVKETCGWALMATKRIVESTPVKIMSSVALPVVAQLRRALCGRGSIAVFLAPCRNYSNDAIAQANQLTRHSFEMSRERQGRR